MVGFLSEIFWAWRYGPLFVKAFILASCGVHFLHVGLLAYIDDF